MTVVTPLLMIWSYCRPCTLRNISYFMLYYTRAAINFETQPHATSRLLATAVEQILHLECIGQISGMNIYTEPEISQ